MERLHSCLNWRRISRWPAKAAQDPELQFEISFCSRLAQRVFSLQARLIRRERILGRFRVGAGITIVNSREFPSMKHHDRRLMGDSQSSRKARGCVKVMQRPS